MSTLTTQESAHRGTWKQLRIGFDDAVERLPGALQREGFGIITQVNMQETMKAKLGVEFRRYRIFGACNPTFALKALEADPRAGLLLPCNVVLFESDDKHAMLGMIDPLAQLGDDSTLGEVAREVGDKLRRVADSFDA